AAEAPGRIARIARRARPWQRRGRDHTLRAAARRRSGKRCARPVHRMLRFRRRRSRTRRAPFRWRLRGRWHRGENPAAPCGRRFRPRLHGQGQLRRTRGNVSGRRGDERASRTHGRNAHREELRVASARRVRRLRVWLRGPAVLSISDRGEPMISLRAPKSAQKSVRRSSRARSRAAPLDGDALARIDAYWRAANYLSVGQIYLYDNPLLKVPLTLDHIKPRLLGHWGTTPGLNFIYTHLNRAIVAHDLSVLFVTGPGHGGPALVASTYLEGTYSEIYSAVSQDQG